MTVYDPDDEGSPVPSAGAGQLPRAGQIPSAGQTAKSPEPHGVGSGYPSPMAYAGMGMVNAVLVLVGGALGYLGDRWLHTLPLLLLAGLLVGACLGVLATRSEWRRYRH